jgi:broad specificity phosphatase PhoE
VLILVRHGRTAHNAGRRLLGRLDPPLDEVGWRQASALSAVDAIAGARRVIASPLGRARDTAAALGPPVTVDERWVEVDYGEYDGMALGDVPAALGDKWRADPEWAPSGGESLAAVGRRVRQACIDVAREAAAADVVVVSHVSPIKAAVAWALGAGDGAVWRMHLDVASVSRVVTGPGLPVLHSYNEVHHRPT